MTHEPTATEVYEYRLACIDAAQAASAQVEQRVECACATDDWTDLRADLHRQERRAERWKSRFWLLLFFVCVLGPVVCAGVIWRLM